MNKPSPLQHAEAEGSISSWQAPLPPVGKAGYLNDAHNISIITSSKNQDPEIALKQGKVKYKKIIPYNIDEYLTPLALAV